MPIGLGWMDAFAPTVFNHGETDLVPGKECSQPHREIGGRAWQGWVDTQVSRSSEILPTLSGRRLVRLMVKSSISRSTAWIRMITLLSRSLPLNARCRDR